MSSQYFIEWTSEFCTGYGSCVSACPHESIFQSERKTLPYKCDLCSGQPECVSLCPGGALSDGPASSSRVP